MWREGCGLGILMMLGIETKKSSRRSIPTKLFAPTILMVSNPQRRCQNLGFGFRRATYVPNKRNESGEIDRSSRRTYHRFLLRVATN